jgi:hypothetical protein
VRYDPTPLLNTPRLPKAVTLRALNLPSPDPEAEAAEAAETAKRAIVTKTIRQGRDAWEQIGNANSFSAWCRIGAALSVGKSRALKITGANAAWGQNYSREFGAWMKAHGFAAMRPSDRSHAITLHENLTAIEQWRASLPDKQRRRLRGAQQNVKRWRRETRQPSEPCRDSVAMAVAAWRCFVSRVRALPTEQAAPVWQAALAEVATMAQV